MFPGPFFRFGAQPAGLLLKGTGFVLVFCACAGRAFALRRHNLPEIDPGSMGSALTLLVGGVLLLTDKWRRK